MMLKIYHEWNKIPLFCPLLLNFIKNNFAQCVTEKERHIVRDRGREREREREKERGRERESERERERERE